MLNKECNTSKLKPEDISWFNVESGKINLRYALVKCNTETDEWEQYITEWSYCDTNNPQNNSIFTGTSVCYTTEASWYA